MTIHFSKAATWWLYRLGFLAIIVLASATTRAASEEPDFDNVLSGTLFLTGEQTVIDAMVLHSTVSMHIAGVIADVRMSQDFENSSDVWVEGIYAFPLPENASIRSMTIRIGERLIEGKILEKQNAEKQYIAANNHGKVAAIVRQERNNLFTTKIANIGPGEKIVVELDYFQTLEYVDDSFSVRLPTTLTPRYITPDKFDAAHFRENPLKTIELIDDAIAVTPPQKMPDDTHSPDLALHIVIESDLPLVEIVSESHAVDVVELDDRYLVSLSAGDTAMDRDFLLSWKATPVDRPRPALYMQESGGEHFGLLVVTPPHAAAIEPRSREMIFVIDTSGSMAGESIRSAKSALLHGLDKLQVVDAFNIIQFNDKARPLYTSPQRANPERIANARRFIKRLEADGGTQMREALELALKNQNKNFLRQIIFITDGSVGNEPELLHFIHSRLDSARLFTVGIGAAPNSFFMRKSAEFGRGSFRFIADSGKAEQAMTTLFDSLQFPVVTGVSLQGDGSDTVFYPQPVPDLYSGQPLVLAVKLTDNTKRLIVKGKLNGADWQQELDVDKALTGSEGITSLWARRRIENLMNEQWTSGDEKLHLNEIINLSIRHSVLSKYTAFLAVEKTPVRDRQNPLHSVKIKNLMPSGNEMLMVDLPKGATGANAWLAAGLLLLLLTIILRTIAGVRRLNL